MDSDTAATLQLANKPFGCGGMNPGDLWRGHEDGDERLMNEGSDGSQRETFISKATLISPLREINLQRRS